MIIVNQATHGEKTYIISLGADNYRVYAQSEKQAVEFVAKTLNSNWYYDALEVELMANFARKSVVDFIADTDLYHCPKYNIYLPKLKIQEVSE